MLRSPSAPTSWEHLRPPPRPLTPPFGKHYPNLSTSFRNSRETWQPDRPTRLGAHHSARLPWLGTLQGRWDELDLKPEASRTLVSSTSDAGDFLGEKAFRTALNQCVHMP